MIRILTFLTILFMSFNGLYSQETYSDDFESYTAGEFLTSQNSTNWRTWAGPAGNSEDVKISTLRAKSGTQSLQIRSATPTTNGPLDIVMKIGGTRNKGIFDASWNMFVEPESFAYFNVQTTSTPGQGWAIEFYFQPDGYAYAIAGGKVFSNKVRYTPGAWINMALNIDIKNNIWSVLIDGECMTTFRANGNSIGGVNFYAFAGANFFIDDVEYVGNLDTVPDLGGIEAGITTMDLDATSLQIAGSDVKYDLGIYNFGTQAINTLEFEITEGSNILNRTIDALDIKTGTEGKISLDWGAKFQDGNNDVSVKLLKVNGTEDHIACNNKFDAQFYAVQPAAHKKVVMEEATGTWCGWCPRGAVVLDQVSPLYDDYIIAIAVHNGDPMAVPAYDNYMGSFPNFAGYPSMIIDRRIVQDPTGSLTPGLQYLRESPAAILHIGAKEDENAEDVLNVSVKLEYLEDLNTGYDVILTMVENNVKGTGSGYNQVNYYAGGANGVMGGYENEPNPVPASRMTYKHVARTYDQSALNIPSGNVGDNHIINYSVTLDPTWKRDQIEIVAILLHPSGYASNANNESIEDAIANGFSASNKLPLLVNSDLKVSPNPATDQIRINMSLNNSTNVIAAVVDMNGNEILRKDLGTSSTSVNQNLSIDQLKAGSYLLKVITKDGIAVSRFIKQ